MLTARYSSFPCALKPCLQSSSDETLKHLPLSPLSLANFLFSGATTPARESGSNPQRPAGTQVQPCARHHIPGPDLCSQENAPTPPHWTLASFLPFSTWPVSTQQASWPSLELLIVFLNILLSTYVPSPWIDCLPQMLSVSFHASLSISKSSLNMPPNTSFSLFNKHLEGSCQAWRHQVNSTGLPIRNPVYPEWEPRRNYFPSTS